MSLHIPKLFSILPRRRRRILLGKKMERGVLESMTHFDTLKIYDMTIRNEKERK